MLRWMLLLTMSLALVGCAGSPTTSALKEAEKKAKDAADAAAKAANESRKAMQKEVEKKLDDLDQQLQTWKDKVAAATGDAKAKLQKAYDDAKAQRDAYAKKLEEFNKASSDAWEKLSEGLKQAGSEAAAAFKNASEEFK